MMMKLVFVAAVATSTTSAVTRLQQAPTGPPAPIPCEVSLSPLEPPDPAEKTWWRATATGPDCTQEVEWTVNPPAPFAFDLVTLNADPFTARSIPTSPIPNLVQVTVCVRTYDGNLVCDTRPALWWPVGPPDPVVVK